MNLLGIDYGWKRIGLALGNDDTKTANPLETLANDQLFFERLREIISDHEIGKIIVGLPRGLEGQHTRQTDDVEAFIGRLRTAFELPIESIDEALTSEAAIERLGQNHAKEDIDKEAAAIILQDYLNL